VGEAILSLRRAQKRGRWEEAGEDARESTMRDSMLVASLTGDIVETVVKRLEVIGGGGGDDDDDDDDDDG
jgi:hypothetical protein